VQLVDRFRFKYERRNADLIEISDDVVIAEGVRLVTHNSSYSNVFSLLSIKFSKIFIEKNSYIC